MREKIKESSKQQRETLKFFDEKALDWKAKALDKKKEPRVNVIKQRNDFALHVVNNRNETDMVLDVGCGIGDLAVAMGKLEANVYGIDFAPGMIDIANDLAAKSGVKNVKFAARDFFTMSIEDELYDMVIANGFIEYISFAQRDDFFGRCIKILKPGGSLVVSSRNRLFNLFSVNAYTEQEMKERVIGDLVRETVAWNMKPKIEEMLKFTPVPLTDPLIEHANTGVGVSTRYQYTPVQLIRLLAEMGYAVKEVSPIHVHGLTPQMKNEWPAMHVKVANALQERALNNVTMLGQASAFMVHAVRVQ